MKKEVKSVSPGAPPVKGGGDSNDGLGGAGAGSPLPNIKSDPDNVTAPVVNGENNSAVANAGNNVNATNSSVCDNSPGTPGTLGANPGDSQGGGQEPRDSSTPSSNPEDKKPVISDTPSNGLIKTETDFLDSFDTKDGGKPLLLLHQTFR